MSDERGQWLTTSQASARLDVAAKTVRRRIERGELEARKSAREGGGVGWLVWIRDECETDNETPIETDKGRERNGQPRRQIERETDNETPIEADKGAERNAHETDSDRDSERVSDLRDEVKFLRGVIEQLQRDGAETRAALREALKSAPKQLTAGDSSAIEPRGGPQTSATAKDSPKSANASGRPGKARESGAIDYNAIADELERSLKL